MTSIIALTDLDAFVIIGAFFVICFAIVMVAVVNKKGDGE